MFKKSKNRGRILNEEQSKTRDIIISKLKNGEYKEIRRACICGAEDEKTIASEDRYSIPVKTVICKNCGLIRCNPYFDEASLADFYEKYYRSLYISSACDENMFEIRVKNGEKIIADIEKSLNIKIENQKVYETGCASGAILQAFKNRGCNVYGCDFGTEWIEFGRRRGMTLENGSYEVLEKYGRADIMILSHVLEHIINPLEFLKGIRNLLKDDGILYTALPLIENIPDSYQKDIFLYLQNAHIYCFSKNTAEYVLECAGFEILDVIQDLTGTNFICRKSDNFRKFNAVNKDEYLYAMKLLKSFEKEIMKKNLKDRIFSIHNRYENGCKIKTINLLGIKIEFRC